MTVSIGAAAGYLGTLMLSKRMSLVGGPLGHLTLPGITLALLYGFDVSLGAFIFLFLAVVLIWFFEKRTRLPLETLTAIIFSSSVALAFFFLPHDEIEIALIGDISQLSLTTTLFSIALSALAFFVVRHIYRQMIMVAISEDIARVEDIKVEKINLIYLLAVALVIGLGIRVVGSLLTAAIIAIPAATSRNLSRNLNQYLLFGTLAGAFASLIGVGLTYFFSLPTGPAIILSSSLLFILSTPFSRRLQ